MNDKSMPDVFTIGLFYAPAPMSEYHYGTMDEGTKMKPENKAQYTRTQAIVELLEGMREPVRICDVEVFIDDTIKAIKDMG